MNSLEYWSDEEGRYPPQMSLSPIPGEPKFRKATQKPKETMKYTEKEYPRNVKTDAKNIEVISHYLECNI